MFFDPNPADAGSAPAPTPAAEPSMAQAMATSGRRIEGSLSELATHASKPINQETTPAEPPSPPAAAEPAQPPVTQAEPPKTPEPTVEPKPEPQPVAKVQEPQQPVVPTLAEVLKNNSIEAVFKELGIESLAGLAQTYKANGNVKDYLEAMTTNWDEVPSEEVMKRHLRQEFAGSNLTEAHYDALYFDRVVNRYKLSDDYSEQERTAGALLLQADAFKIRQQFKAEQQSKLIPPPPAAPVVDTVALQQQQAEQQALEDHRRSVEAHPLSKEILSSGKMFLGEGDQKYTLNFSDPKKAVEMAADPVAFGNAYAELPHEHQMFINAYILDPVQTLKDYAAHYTALGGKQTIDPIENPSQPGSPAAAVPVKAPETPAQAMATKGVVRTR